MPGTLALEASSACTLVVQQNPLVAWCRGTLHSLAAPFFLVPCVRCVACPRRVGHPNPPSV